MFCLRRRRGKYFGRHGSSVTKHGVDRDVKYYSLSIRLSNPRLNPQECGALVFLFRKEKKRYILLRLTTLKANNDLIFFSLNSRNSNNEQRTAFLWILLGSPGQGIVLPKATQEGSICSMSEMRFPECTVSSSDRSRHTEGARKK